MPLSVFLETDFQPTMVETVPESEVNFIFCWISSITDSLLCTYTLHEFAAYFLAVGPKFKITERTCTSMAICFCPTDYPELTLGLFENYNTGLS